jgi:transcriptional regulator with XRE-family HTH domain
MGINLERFQAHRLKRGLNKREMAKLCGLHELQIHRYESGISDPSSDGLKIIAAVLDVSVDYLLGITDEPRGHYGDGEIKEEEHAILDAYRRDGWPGIIKLGADQLIQKTKSPD